MILTSMNKSSENNEKSATGLPFFQLPSLFFYSSTLTDPCRAMPSEDPKWSVLPNGRSVGFLFRALGDFFTAMMGAVSLVVCLLGF